MTDIAGCRRLDVAILRIWQRSRGKQTFPLCLPCHRLQWDPLAVSPDRCVIIIRGIHNEYFTVKFKFYDLGVIAQIDIRIIVVISAGRSGVKWFSIVACGNVGIQEIARIAVFHANILRRVIFVGRFEKNLQFFDDLEKSPCLVCPSRQF